MMGGSLAERDTRWNGEIVERTRNDSPVSHYTKSSLNVSDC